MSVKVGLVMSSSAAAPRPLMMPFASVVLPAPSSPVRRTKSGGRKPAASSLPREIVSSAERERISTAGISERLNRVAELRTCGGNCPNDIGGDEGRFAKFLGRQIARQAMQVDPACKR